MKKLFTLLFTVGSLTTAFSQYNNNNNNDRRGRDDNSTAYESKNGNGDYSKPGTYNRNGDRKDYAYSDHRYNESFSMRSSECDFQIHRINRQYDYKIKSVHANRYLRNREKAYEVSNLNQQRRDEIRTIMVRYSNKRNRYHDGHPGKW